MAIPDGNYTLGPDSGRLLIKTARTGLGARAGHDLTIEVTRWRCDVVLATANPGDSAVTLEAEVDSFEVREGTGGVKPLTDADRAEIKRTIRDKILHAGQNPTITFASTRVSGSPESFGIEGNLTVVGVSQLVTVDGRLTDGRAQGSATIVQSRWGIRPYSAFFGALKLRDQVEVEFDIDMKSAV
jgi:polyisoprenoid-binding protein YceI